VYGLLASAGANGRLAPDMLLVIALGLAILVCFVFVEARRPHAMVPLTLFRSRAFSGSNLLTLLLYAALAAALFFLPFDLIQVQGYSATAAGAALLPFVLAISVLSRWAGGLAARRGARLPLVVGPLMAAGGFLLLALPGGTNRGSASYFWTFFPGLFLLGAGMGVSVAPLTTAVMGAVESSHAGLASGINNAVARTAGLLAIAGLGLVLNARFNATLDQALSTLALAPDVSALVDAQRAKLAGPDLSLLPAESRAQLASMFAQAFVAGFRALMLVCAALALASAAVGFGSFRRDAS
jgi:predicted MFS family arabinose efflux permease